MDNAEHVADRITHPSKDQMALDITCAWLASGKYAPGLKHEDSAELAVKLFEAVRARVAKVKSGL